MLTREMKARVHRVLERRQKAVEAIQSCFAARRQRSAKGEEEFQRTLRSLDLWIVELSFIIENVGLFLYKRRLEEICGMVESAGEYGPRSTLISLRESIFRASDAHRPPSEVELRGLERIADKCLQELGAITDNVAEVLIGESSQPYYPEIDGLEPLPESDSIFVIMSFRPELEAIYETAIEGAINNCQLQSCRMDNEEPVHEISHTILEKIALAKLVICDLTHERPNCYYELGFARGLRKRIILTSRDDHDPRRPNREEGSPRVHFDVDSHKVTYWEPDDLPQFRRDLIVRIQYLLGQ